MDAFFWLFDVFWLLGELLSRRAGRWILAIILVVILGVIVYVVLVQNREPVQQTQVVHP